MLRLRQILQMLGNGIPQADICGIVHCSKRTVSGYRKIASTTGKCIEELLAMADSELETIFMPPEAVLNDGGRKQEKHVSSYRKKNDYAYHNIYEPGEEWQIDFAGDALFLTDRLTKVKQKLVVLVCVMPYSNLPFMMATPNATTEWFFHGLNKGLEFMGAIPHTAKSDNMKQWVTKSDRYSLTFSDANVTLFILFYV